MDDEHEIRRVLELYGSFKKKYVRMFDDMGWEFYSSDGDVFVTQSSLSGILSVVKYRMWTVINEREDRDRSL